MIHDLAANNGERNGLVVLSLILLSFLEGRGDVSGAPNHQGLLLLPVTYGISLEGEELCLLPAPSAVVVQGCQVLGICLAWDLPAALWYHSMWCCCCLTLGTGSLLWASCSFERSLPLIPLHCWRILTETVCWATLFYPQGVSRASRLVSVMRNQSFHSSCVWHKSRNVSYFDGHSHALLVSLSPHHSPSKPVWPRTLYLYSSCPWLSPIFTCITLNIKWILSHLLMYSFIAFKYVNLILWKENYNLWRIGVYFGGFGRSWINILQELRYFLSGIWGDQCIIFSDQGSTDPPWGVCVWGGGAQGSNFKLRLDSLRPW